MKLGALLAPPRVRLGMACESLDTARTVLLEALVASGAIDDVDRLQTRVAEERGEDMVAIADRAFLLHYRTDTATALEAAIGVCAEGVRRALEDGSEQRAPIVVVVVGPPRHAVRHLQVVRAFVRLLSKEDVVEAIVAAPTPDALIALPAFADQELPEQLLVRDLMTDRPRTTTADVPLRAAARELVRTGLGALPVVDDNQFLLGMLSERELMRHLLATEALTDDSARQAAPFSRDQRTVRDVMTRQVLCVAPEQPAAEVAALMSNKDVERVPVVREGRLVGFLTRGDIVRKLIGP
ncbi:MAG TPA: CBS domain-containing protein [Gemmatimonadaceae bacterium]|nr:CBS domain-containing protein [Gemmatimonadaceae bacterium]